MQIESQSRAPNDTLITFFKCKDIGEAPMEVEALWRSAIEHHIIKFLDTNAGQEIQLQLPMQGSGQHSAVNCGEFRPHRQLTNTHSPTPTPTHTRVCESESPSKQRKP